MLDTKPLYDKKPPQLSSESSLSSEVAEYCAKFKGRVCIESEKGLQMLTDYCEALELGYTAQDLVDCGTGKWSSEGGSSSSAKESSSSSKGSSSSSLLSSSSESHCEAFSPVCGRNPQDLSQKNFHSQCDAEKAGYIQITLGECLGEPQECDLTYEPVCAEDPNTGETSNFVNECFAKKWNWETVFYGTCEEMNAQNVCKFEGNAYGVNQNFISKSGKSCVCRSAGVLCEETKPKETYLSQKSYLAIGAQCLNFFISCNEGTEFFSDQTGCGCAVSAVCPLNIHCSEGDQTQNYELCWGHEQEACPSSEKLYWVESVGLDWQSESLSLEEEKFIVENQELIQENWDLIEPNLPMILENRALFEQNLPLIEENIDVYLPLFLLGLQMQSQ